MSPNSYEVGFVPKSASESCNLFCSYQPALEAYDKVYCLKTNIHISVHVTNKNVCWDALGICKAPVVVSDTLMLTLCAWPCCFMRSYLFSWQVVTSCGEKIQHWWVKTVFVHFCPVGEVTCVGLNKVGPVFLVAHNWILIISILNAFTTNLYCLLPFTELHDPWFFWSWVTICVSSNCFLFSFFFLS